MTSGTKRARRRFYVGNVVRKDDGEYYKILAIKKGIYTLTSIVGEVTEDELRPLTMLERNVTNCPCCGYPKCGHKHGEAHHAKR